MQPILQGVIWFWPLFAAIKNPLENGCPACQYNTIERRLLAASLFAMCRYLCK